RDLRSNLVGDAFAPALPSAPAPDTSSYAYVFEWDGYFAPRALQRVFDQDLLARVATQTFTAATTHGDREFARGSIVVPFDRQAVEHTVIHELMQTIAAEDGLTVHALTSGRSAVGTAGIQVGGPSVAPISEPSALVVVGDDITLYDAGEIWHLLDYRMHMPVSLRDRDQLDGIDWSRYTHIVFSSGEYEDYLPDYADRLRQWVAEGGTIIGLRDAAAWVRANVLDWIDADSPEGIAAAAAMEDEEIEDEAIPGRMPYAEKSDYEAIDVIGGAIFSADLDNTHPLGFGFRNRDIQLHKNTEEPLAATSNPFGTVIRYSDNPVYSGYVSEANQGALAGTPALIAERLGNGSVILFADNPNFRGYWYGTNKLFLNALFFSTVFEAPAED
ncbi:MAG: peptidase, partial [Gammaproteobacteria bacterium]|nr:peptidase [Gammaproteobacteria bacterium]